LAVVPPVAEEPPVEEDEPPDIVVDVSVGRWVLLVEFAQNPKLVDCPGAMVPL
jgi:hypothetical protein